MRFVVVDCDPETAVLGQQLTQQHQPRIHHRQPLTVFQIVVVVFEGALSVVGRVNEDALHPPSIKRNQRFQGQQVIALDDEIVRRNGSVAVSSFALQQVVNLIRSLQRHRQ